jgi:hypothetical protein
MNRRNAMLTFGIGALAAAIPAPKAGADPSRPAPPPSAPASGAQPGGFLFPVLNLAVGGSGGGDPAAGSYPAEMLIDWVRVF